MTTGRAAFCGLLLCLTVAHAHAHHAFSPVYDEAKRITVSGTVKEFRFINPHAMMTLDVTDEKGRVVVWTVEFAGRLNLTEVGWTEKSILPGDKVTVTGNPTHTNSPRMFFRGLVKSDGTELLPAAAQRDKELDELRRQRRTGQ